MDFPREDLGVNLRLFTAIGAMTRLHSCLAFRDEKELSAICLESSRHIAAAAAIAAAASLLSLARMKYGLFYI
jgi:hypothetical protein